MNYKSLILAHHAYYLYEPKASAYDKYLARKKDELWKSPNLQSSEISKLFDFIKTWDYHFRGSPEKIQNIYRDVFYDLNFLNDHTFYDLDFQNKENIQKIGHVFERFANCTFEGREESTDASKILQTILPELYVMWDRKIRDAIIGDANKKSSYYYTNYFLPEMKRRINLAIGSCQKSENLSRDESIAFITNKCDGKTLAKIIDEYNYMKNTKTDDFKEYLTNYDELPEDLSKFLESHVEFNKIQKVKDINEIIQDRKKSEDKTGAKLH